MPSKVDIIVAASLVATYFLLVVFLLPSSEYARAIGTGLVIYAGVAIAAQKLPLAKVAPASVLAVAVIAVVAFWMPTFPAMGGSTPAAVPVGFVSVQAAAMLWAALRWRSRPRATKRTSLPTALKYGLIGAVALSAIASIPIVVALFASRFLATEFLLVYPAYFAGFLAAALVFWLLQGIQHLATGRYLIGCLAGFCLYCAVAPVVSLIKDESIPLRVMIGIAIVAGSLVGPAVSLSMDGAA